MSEHQQTESRLCPNCGMGELVDFYEVEQVPVHSVLLMPVRLQALSYPRGDIRLAACAACGFISNRAFDPGLHEYDAEYESTQSYSPTFDAFARRLAAGLVQRHDLHGKRIIEIGCGNGEFLAHLCELGGSYGTGFDPSYQANRLHTTARERLRFVKDFYSERYAHYPADFVVCKMTLEHIAHPSQFLGMVRKATQRSGQAVFFFQVPEVTRILEEVAFWDIYYEHCSYFSPGSLARLFLKHGFDVLRLEQDYGDQYVMIEAVPGKGELKIAFDLEKDLAALLHAKSAFAAAIGGRLQAWKNFLGGLKNSNQRVVLWGAGSKGVAFLTTLSIMNEIEYCVDINPHKSGTYMPGTGQQIVSPEFLQGYQPHVVIAMNPVYQREIGNALSEMGVTARLMTVNDLVEQAL